MKNKLKILSTSLFMGAATLMVAAILPMGEMSISNSTRTKAGANYSLTLNSSNKYTGGSQKTVTTANGGFVNFSYTNAISSSKGHVVLQDGGTLRNIDQLTALNIFLPTFTLSTGASLKFRASNDGSNWGEYSSIKSYTNETNNFFTLPNMLYLEFKADGGSVDIESISFGYSCLTGDCEGDVDYEYGTTYSDSNINNYNVNTSYNDLKDGLVVSTLKNDGTSDVLNSSLYDVSVTNQSGSIVDKNAKLAKGTYTAKIIRKDKAFADISYNFVVSPFGFGDDINQPQKIHTQNQENYLNFSKDYYNITSSDLNTYSASGTVENSFPNQVKVTWDYSAPAGKSVNRYDVVTGQYADLSDGYTITGTTSKELSFYNAFLGDNYFKVIANLSDGTKEESPIRIFKVDEQAPRNLKVGTMSNCRDMGGRTNIVGGKIKQGLIYRTSDPRNSGIGNIDEWTTRMGIKTEIYVKETSSYTDSPLGKSVNFVNASMDYGSTPYSNMSRNAERLRKVFSTLGDINNYPVMYHCRIGTDRTGVCAVAINGLLGVPFNEIIQDYGFSNFGLISGQRYPHKTPDNDGDDPAKYIDEILALPGNNFQEQTVYYLLSIGVPLETLRNIIDILTIGNKPTLPTDIAVAKGDILTNHGGTKKTSSDFTNPDTYYEISGTSKSISFEYTLEEDADINVLAYLGSTDSSSSKKLANGISLSIDGDSKTICDKTYYLAGFGTTQTNRRTGYMFNLLGTYTLSSGTHIVTIAGKNGDTFKIGSISMIGGNGVASPDESSGDDPGEDEPTYGTPITFKISNASGWNSATTKWSTKSGTSSKATWNVGNTLPSGNYMVTISCQMTSSSHSDRYFYNQYETDGNKQNGDKSSESPYRYWFEIGGNIFYPTNRNSWGDNGMSNSSFTSVEFISSITIPANTTSITMVHGNIGYSLIIESVSFIPII